MTENSAPQRPVTTRDVAERAGVAQSTVSRALRNNPQVSAGVRDRVLAIARELGYRPNPFVAAFTAQVRSYRRSAQGALIAFLDCHPKGAPGYAAAYLRGASERAHALGYSTEVVHLHELDWSFDRLNRMLWTRSIAGLLVLPVPLEFDLSALRFEHLASATVDPSLHTPRLHRAETNYYAAMQVALAALEARGYERITFCTTREEVERIGYEWLGAFTSWQRMKPARGRMDCYIATEWDEADFAKWLRRHQPGAIVSNCMLFFDWAKKLRLTPKPGFASLSVDASSDTASGIDQNAEQVGAAAIDLIIGQIHRNERGVAAVAKTLMVDGFWVDGKTARPLPAASPALAQR